MTIHYHYHDLPKDLFLESTIAIDTETMGLNFHRDRLCVVQLSDGTGDAHIVHFPDKNYNAPNLKMLFDDSNRLFLFHYARFDLAVLKKFLNISVKNVYCTKIASRLVRTNSESHSLKTLCHELLNIDLSKQQQCSDWGTQKLSEQQLDYAASDVLYLHDITAKLDSRLKREHRDSLAQSCFNFLTCRVDLDLAGWEDQDIFSH